MWDFDKNLVVLKYDYTCMVTKNSRWMKIYTCKAFCFFLDFLQFATWIDASVGNYNVCIATHFLDFAGFALVTVCMCVSVCFIVA